MSVIYFDIKASNRQSKQVTLFL